MAVVDTAAGVVSMVVAAASAVVVAASRARLAGASGDRRVAVASSPIAAVRSVDHRRIFTVRQSMVEATAGDLDIIVPRGIPAAIIIMASRIITSTATITAEATSMMGPTTAIPMAVRAAGFTARR